MRVDSDVFIEICCWSVYFGPAVTFRTYLSAMVGSVFEDLMVRILLNVVVFAYSALNICKAQKIYMYRNVMAWHLLDAAQYSISGGIG